MDITGQILSIAGACIVSAGGIGAIIIGVIKFTSNSIANALSKKYELKLNPAMSPALGEALRRAGGEVLHALPPSPFIPSRHFAP